MITIQLLQVNQQLQELGKVNVSLFFEGATFDYGEVIIADGANKPWAFRMEGTGALNTRTFFTEEITVDGTNGVKYIAIHDHHLIAAGVEDNLNTVYYSVYNDPNNWRHWCRFSNYIRPSTRY